MEIAFVSVVLVVTVVLLVSEWLPVDLTALGVMALLMVGGTLSPAEAVAGFANPAPLTVGALFIVGRAMVRTGALEFLSRALLDQLGQHRRLLWLVIFGLVAVLSAFINNTPVVVLFIGIIMTVCCHMQMSPAKLLLPVSFMSILAGTTTLIGTSTNIIVSDMSVSLGAAPIGMFELTLLGVPIALVGGAFLFFFAGRMLPGHKEPICESAGGPEQKYISELKVNADGGLVGQAVEALFPSGASPVELFEVIRGQEILDPVRDRIVVQADDILLLKAPASELTEMLRAGGVRLPRAAPADPGLRFDPNAMFVELIVPPTSELVGQRLVDTEMGLVDGSKILGVKHRGLHYSERALSRLRFAVGDILFAHCSAERIGQLRSRGDLIVVEDVAQTMVRRRRAPIALIVFVSMVALASTGLLDILSASMAAAFLLIATGCLTVREAYRSVDVKVLLLIIGTLALGLALQKSGAAALYARGFLALFAGGGPGWVLAAFIILTSLLSHLLSNNATAVLLVPIGFATAHALGVDPRPFVIGICFGASACFASPIGYQTNLLVYGPGGYRFGDYVRLGMPLNVLVWTGAALGIPLLWPF